MNCNLQISNLGSWIKFDHFIIAKAKKMLNKNLDDRLTQLAITAQKYQHQTLERQIALTKLMREIFKSGKLAVLRKNEYYHLYDYVFDEAIQELLIYICRNIEKYDPQKGSMMQWIFFLFYHRYIKQAFQKIHKEQNQQNIIRKLLALDKHINEKKPSLSDLVRACIEADPENICKSKHIQNHPEANFQFLAIRRFSSHHWKDIAADLNLSVPTVSGFYYRSAVKLAPKLKKYCENMEF